MDKKKPAVKEKFTLVLSDGEGNFSPPSLWIRRWNRLRSLEMKEHQIFPRVIALGLIDDPIQAVVLKVYPLVEPSFGGL